MVLSVVVLALLAGFALAQMSASSDARQAQRQAERYGQMLARAMWDLDDELVRHVAAPMLASASFARMRLAHPDGAIFIEVHGPVLEDETDRVLDWVGLLPLRSMRRPVMYEGSEIGSIELDWRDNAVYVNLYVFIASLLLGLSVGLALRNEVRQRELDRVRLALERERREEAETKLQTREEQLLEVRRLEALGRLAGGVAHDFNNVLTAILGTAGLLMRQRPDARDQQELQVIVDASRRAAELTRQLLAFGRRQILRPRVLQINDVLRGMRRILERALGDEIELVLELDETLPAVRADPGQMEQVLMNLVVNARDAIEGAGRVTIRTRRAPDSQAPPHAGIGSEVVCGGRVAIEVHDNGSGMTEETRARVFEPFFTTKQAHGGTGLGLSTVYGIVQQSGGEIALDTTLGQGSVFTVLLPTTDESAEASESAMQETGGRRLQGGNVLVVDDNDAVRSVMVKTLRWAGHQVLEAQDGVHALETVKTMRSLDVVVADLAMPRMGGMELTERLRKSHPHVGLVLVSGLVPRAAADKLEATTDIVVLKKPFGPVELARAVAEVLEGTT